MTITRRSLFGLPAGIQPGSQLTEREVPLSQGISSSTAWPLMPPGSSVSMTNFLPLDGVLKPRSQFSSLNTIRSPSGGLIKGMAELIPQDHGFPRVWVSGSTDHALLQSNGSISHASFVSAFGLGVSGIGSHMRWQYCQTYAANLDDNMIIAAGSGTDSVGLVSFATLHCLYNISGAASLPPVYSYLTSAPKARAVCAFDNYIVAFHTQAGGNPLVNRVQWCVRGNPSNWTSEGSGFEDLLAMNGVGMAIKDGGDGRLIIFSDKEIWFGQGATYPAQFQFFPLERVGCPFPGTIRETDLGILFLGSDRRLRLLPKGGGASQEVSSSLQPELRSMVVHSNTTSPTWGLYDPTTRLYHLFLETQAPPVGTQTVAPDRAVVVNIASGEWGWMDYSLVSFPTCGIALSHLNDNRVGYTKNEGLMFGVSLGTVYSTNSSIGSENGFPVASTWRSAPLGLDLPGNYKQITQVDIDYRSTSTATVSLSFSQDGGNAFGNTINTVPLPRAPVGGRATTQMYVGGAFPVIHLNSVATGYELHRQDVTLIVGGRKSG